ncbi:alpha/beta hydrolase [Paludisphaera borealis]|uniref:BD-FAE-like domain-containing protein n=1 Tax=Paludisphaera borealis TaxID=1387353 RepID=A0A1U7CLR8_9BACT|nr:alpha/beta hydrolase [Paludisphaera borealis]APW59823.1 hypothetical protein BSF38_01281 [Paludisphaera borealis]
MTAAATAWVWAGAAEKPTEPPLPEGVVVIRDLTYRYFGEQRLALDLYLPADAGPPTAGTGELRPAIVAVHGGSWVGGSKRDYGPQFARFAEHGIVVAVVDYRLARPGAPSWDGALEDVAAAVDWLGVYAETYRVDTDRLAIVGTSAGGFLAAHIGLGTPLRSYMAGARQQVKAAVCLSTPTSLVELAAFRSLKHDPLRDLMGLSSGDLDNMVRTKLNEWVTLISHRARPMLLIHGTDDLWVPISQARELHKRLGWMAIPSRLIEINGARHGFELRVEAPSPRDLLPDVLDFLNEVWRERASDAA